MTHPLSGSLPKTSGSADLIALFQKSSVNAVDMNGGFASVLDQSVNAPQRDTAQRDGRHEARRNSETAPSPSPNTAANASPSADARPTDSSGGAQGQSGQANQSGSTPSSDTRSANGRTADATTADDTTADTAEDAVDPATLAVLGAVIAALGGQQAAADTAEAGDAGDPLADATGRQRANPARLLADGSTTAASEDDASLLADSVRGTQDKPGAGLSTKPEPRVAVTTVAQATAVAAPNTGVASPQAAAPLVQAADANPATVAATMATAPLAGRSAASVQQLPVYTPAGQRGWTEDVGNRLIWMANRGETRAELVLTPPSLGKLGISLQMNGDQTTAHFVAATPAAREALEQAIPRLRELLQQAGINLGQTDVSTSGEQQARDEAGNARRGSGQHPIGALAGDANAADLPVSSGSWVRTGTGMVDTFA